MYDDLFLFIKLAGFGSFTKASKELQLYQSLDKPEEEV